MTVQAIKLGINAIAKELTELRQRLEVVESRQILAVQSKADDMLSELEVKSSPLAVVHTTVERRVQKSVEEFKLSRRVDDIRSVEFDREIGALRVIYTKEN